VLFLDELPEFPRAILESLRQPLETGRVMIARAQAKVSYPAKIQLIAAMNPCRCGYLMDKERACHRAPRCSQEYQAKISGPLLDRLDLTLELAPVPPQELSLPPSGESSETVAQRVAQAREKQKKRFQKLGAPENVRTNAEASGNLLQEIAMPSTEAQKQLTDAAEKLKLSSRGYHRVLRVARTIADLQEEEVVETHHVGEALWYRQVKHEVA